MFKSLFSKRAAREKWDAGLVWSRLRYLEPEGPTRCLNLLSRSQACGRVALYHRPGEAVSQLYLGTPETHMRLLQRMVADFGFSLQQELPQPKSSEDNISPVQRMTAVADLPWDKPFVAHIVNEFAFVSLVGDENDQGRIPGAYLPQPPSGEPKHGPSAWRLPDRPPAGLTAQPSWNDQQPPTHLVAAEPDPRRWLLGRSRTGIPLHVPGRVNIYGRREAVVEWLAHQVTQMISLDPANMVVIDGVGDLAPRLKRKAAVTRLLGDQLAYVDIDGVSLANGFNPLAAAPGETEAEMALRWQRWFQGMNVHPQGIQLLTRAQRDGVGDIPSLRKWLKQVERAGQHTAVSSLGVALNRLTANRSLREWLEWPTNRFDVLREGALFFACKGTTWERQHLLRAALLAGLSMSDARLVVHGATGDRLDRWQLQQHKQIIVSNGPLLPDSVIVLVESHPQNAAMLTERFLFGDPYLGENLALLGRGESIVNSRGDIAYTSWNGTFKG